MFFQVLETPKDNFEVGNEKGHIPPKAGTHVGVVSNLSRPVLFIN